jgi:hypothetical protein
MTAIKCMDAAGFWRLPLAPTRSGLAASAAALRKFSMKYFFHLMNHTEQVLDDVDTEIRSPEQAYAPATQAIRDLLAEGEQAAEWSGWRLEVTDPAGAPVFSIDLAGRPH